MSRKKKLYSKKNQLAISNKTPKANPQTHQQKLRESEDRWQLVLRANNDGIWDWNLEKDEVFFSTRWKEMLGYKKHELVNHIETWKNLLHPDDVGRVTEVLQAYLEKRISQYSVEFRLRCQDGTYKWILSRGQALWDREGKPKRMAGSHTDISDRKQEQTLLRSLIDCIPDVIFYKNQDGIYLACNNAFEEFVGRKATEILGSTDFDLFPQTVATCLREQDCQMIAQATPQRHEEWVNYPDGRRRLLDTLKTPFFSHDGKLKGLISISRDITERHQAEQALRQSEEKYRTLVANIPGVVYRCACDADWTMEFLSDFIEEITGYPACDYIHNQVRSFASIIYPEDQEIVERTVNEAVALKQPYILEYRVIHADGSLRWVYEKGQGIYSDGGELLWLDGAIFDITERKQAEEALKSAKKAADAANRAKSEFLASMSHELRTPLNAILGFTQVMNRDSSLNTEQQQNLSIINRSGEHLLALINDILEMSKIEAGRTTLNQNSFDLYRLLDSLEQMLRVKAQAKDLQLICERTPDVPQYIQTDEGKLRQVLLNLLGNAIKFTEEGGVTLRVKSVSGKWSVASGNIQINDGSLTNNKPDNGLLTTNAVRLRFEVEDTGAGITLEEVDKLFEAFGQTETGRKSQQGTGLGLPISQKFVQLMGGDISVSTILDNGSLFTFEIPVALANATEIQIAQPPRKVIGLAAGQPKYRILVVDDRLESRLLLVKLLSSTGFSVREAANGKEAVEIWENWQPHLIWMDMRMPVMDGYEATKTIKSTTKGQATVIIALTASVFEEERTVILSAGCDDFMRKPFRQDKLWEKMAQHLGIRFLYDDAEQMAESEMKSAFILNPSSVQVMPAEWIAQLHQAAIECSDDLLLELIEQIPEKYSSLAIALTNLANNFLFEQITALTQPLIRGA